MSLLTRLVAIPVVIVAVVAGIWVTGGLLTNDFTVAMWLTAGWMGLAGLLCLGVAARSRPLRWPVLGAYVVTATVAGAYLTSSTFLDDEVSERVAVAAPAQAPMAAMRSSMERPAPRNVLQREGAFRAVRHASRGRAEVIRLARGGRVLTLTGFETDNGPDLRLYLVAGEPRAEGDVDDYVDLGALKGNMGDQQYRLPRDLDVGRYDTVVVWCRAFSVLFARAPLRSVMS